MISATYTYRGKTLTDCTPAELLAAARYAAAPPTTIPAGALTAIYEEIARREVVLRVVSVS